MSEVVRDGHQYFLVELVWCLKQKIVIMKSLREVLVRNSRSGYPSLPQNGDRFRRIVGGCVCVCVDECGFKQVWGNLLVCHEFRAFKLYQRGKQIATTQLEFNTVVNFL